MYSLLSFVQVRVDAALYDDTVYLFGLNGPTVQCMSVKHFQRLRAQLGHATILYVYTLVPAVPNAPHFPLLAVLHNNSRKPFTIWLILNMWQLLWQVISHFMPWWLHPDLLATKDSAFAA